MKYFAPWLLIISFVGIAIFGFAIFDHAMHSPNSDCVASTVDGTMCPTSVASMVLHHISVLQAFLQTLLPSTVLTLLLALFFAIIAYFLLRKKIFLPQFYFVRSRYRISATHFRYQKIISWLALFELSPAL